MLTVHHGGRAEGLLDVLAGLLAVPAADPFTREVVSVPTRGVERWIQQRLARRLGAGSGEDGIAANIDFPFPGRFVRDALGTADVSDPWLVDALSWEVLVQLRSNDPGATYPRAAQIARLFDRYAVYRPGLLHAWRAGYDTGPDGAVLEPGQRWQPDLWRRLAAILGEDPAARTGSRGTGGGPLVASGSASSERHQPGDGCSTRRWTSRWTASADTTSVCNAGSALTANTTTRSGSGDDDGSRRSESSARPARAAGSSPRIVRRRRQSSGCHLCPGSSAAPSGPVSYPARHACSRPGR